MTHTLHPEMQTIVRKCAVDCSSLHAEDIADLIYKHLWPYLSLPKDNEPNYDAACMYVIANGLKITAADVKWILKAATVEDNESVPKQSIPEIEKILDAITLDYFLQSWEAWKKIDYKQRMKDKIVKHLWPYIHMPTDQKDNEPLPEKDDLNLEPWNIVEICMFDSVWQPWIKWMFLRKDWDMYVVSHKSDQEYEWHFEKRHIRRIRIGREEQKQSISQIKKIEYSKDVEELLEYEKSVNKAGIYMALYELRKWSRKMTNAHNEIIDYITNTLPPQS